MMIVVNVYFPYIFNTNIVKDYTIQNIFHPNYIVIFTRKRKILPYVIEMLLAVYYKYS
ncbi:hypothetical protein Huta_2780 [Halorhabdus utahensis DSM 12940]|uniref:Uncharacterized protein n=1 Tax=Halorhabdus utahensis (strain DSM 12940 / JCM 11049 / AX-2) TaxID=519442 RepID=C7NR28_HALUD|nr:hypothetical protein Huta_2780 [Halorhabdus utahensis DSM 12940]